MSGRCILLLVVVALSIGAAVPSTADPGWPRVFKQDRRQLTVHQPQVDDWHGHTNIHCRCAIAVKEVLAEDRFGVAAIDVVTVVDSTARVVALVPTVRDVRFVNVSETEKASLLRAVDELNPPGHSTTLALHRIIAYLDPSSHPVQRPAHPFSF